MQKITQKKYKGQLGLDTVKAVILSLLIITVIAVATFFILYSLLPTAESLAADKAGVNVVNESVVLTPTGNGIELAKNVGVRNCKATVSAVVNATDGDTIPVAKYVVTGCFIKAAGTGAGSYAFNATKVTYTYSYDDPYTNNLVQNISYGAESFFTQVPTFFVLLGVVVLILIIAVVIVAVTRFSPTGKSNEGL
jgi:hypothetical protein